MNCTNIFWTIALTLTLALGAACSKDETGDSPAKKQTAGEESAGAAADDDHATAATGGGGHAGADVVPGSHEDWCGEHGVPESQCTRCNAELAAAFKATGDWCAEHGLPESQCTRCNPDLEIVRPPAAGAETK